MPTMVGFYQPAQAAHFPSSLLKLNRSLAELGRPDQLQDRGAIFSGQQIPKGAQPIAQACAGHQFGV